MLLGANNSFADEYGWWDGAMSIGGGTTDITAWSTDGNNPTDLGELLNMTINSISFKVWDNANNRGSAQVYFRIWDGGSEPVGSDQSIYISTCSKIPNTTHDYAISWTGVSDLADAVGLEFEAGKTYYIDMWAVTYRSSDTGTDAEWYSGTNSSNYHAKFTYVPNKAKIGASGWTTFSSHEVLNLASMTASTGSVEAFYASSVNASGVTMTPTTATIAAGQGIMLKGTAGATITITIANTSGSTLSGNLLRGCKDGAVVNYDSNSSYNYVMVNVNGDPTFQLIEEGDYGTVLIPSGKAYLSLTSAPGGAPSAIRIIDEEENATNIQSIEAGEKAVKFVENGKLLIMREGVVYDATGRAIR